MFKAQLHDKLNKHSVIIFPMKTSLINLLQKGCCEFPTAFGYNLINNTPKSASISAVNAAIKLLRVGTNYLVLVYLHRIVILLSYLTGNTGYTNKICNYSPRWKRRGRRGVYLIKEEEKQ